MAKSRNTVTDTSIFYDYTRILSYDALFCMVIGARGMGKTYGAKKLIIRDYLKDGSQFIYLRRFHTELLGINNFFNDVQSEFPNYQFRVHGRLAQMSIDSDKPSWETIGYFIALSSAASKKSIAYPNVKRIVFDEFLLAKGFVRYLPNEYKALLEFVNTVDRYQDRVTVVMLANGVDIVNPYFLEWNVQPHLGRIQKYQGGLVMADFPDSLDYAEYAKQSKLGRLIAGTDYERYAIGNEFTTGETSLIRTFPRNFNYMFNLTHAGYNMSIWSDDAFLEFHVCRRTVKEPRLFSLTVRDTNDDSVVLEPGDHYLRMLKKSYRHRNMTFNSHQTHTAFQNVLAFLNTK